MTGAQDKIEELRQIIYGALDSRDYQLAVKEIDNLCKVQPQEALGLLTAVEIERGDFSAAQKACQRLIDIAPQDAYTIFLRARIAFMEHKHVTAVQLLEDLPVGDLDRVYQEKIYNLLGQCYRFLGEGKKAAEAYLQAARRSEDDGLAALEYSNYLFNLHYQHLPLAAEKQAAEGYAVFYKHVPKLYRHHGGAQNKLRIGYISPDFREHVCLYFVYGMLTGASKDKFTIYAYAANEEDDYSRLLAGKVDGWRNIYGMSPRQAAQVIAEDQIDILVDFSGHGKSNCLPILAYRPAPVQISGIGYFASTGLPQVDYFLSDEILVACGAQQGFTEKLLPLPHSHFCYVPMSAIAPCIQPPCLQKGYITFGSFNNFTKINEAVLALWREILHRVPDSRLLLKAEVFSYEESAVYARAKLEAAGLPMERVECRPISRDYLVEYADVDIALDTFPYPGGGTSCDALYMGVPVISLAGESHGERFGLSLLGNLGLSELCAEDYAGYVERAVLLAGAPELLQELHRTLRRRMESSPLMDVKGYVAEVEAAYETIWQRHIQQQLPKNTSQLECMAVNALDAGNTRQTETILLFLKELTREVTPYQQFLWANVFFQQKNYDKAMQFVQEAIASKQLEKSRLGAAYHLLANVYKKQGLRKQAAQAYLWSSACKGLATGKEIDYSNYLLNLAFGKEPGEEYLAAATGYGQILQVVAQLPPLNKDYGHPRLRIGYLSADFNHHVVAGFAQAFFQEFDGDLFDVYGYQLGESDDITADFIRYATVWRDLRGMELGAAARLIRADEIDILMDLGGHTANNGLPVLACRPAPIQLSGVGYFASTGLSTVDYFLTDMYTATADEEVCFTERLLRLPHSHICWQPLPGNEHLVSLLPARKRGYVTFGSLNQWDKVTDEMLKAWGEILQVMPESKLFIKSGVFDDGGRCQQEQKRMMACGLPMDRTILEGRSEDYLAAYDGIDIALDTYPYPGGGTTCDALYMGVPVISLRGHSHHGRFGYSLLKNAGLSELCVVDSLEEYVDKAVSLAKNVEQLQELRQNIRRSLQQTAVMNPALYMVDAEEAYLQIWADYASRFACERENILPKVEQYYQQQDWHNLVELAAKAYYAAAGHQLLLARYLAFAYYQLKNHAKTCFWSEKALQLDKYDRQMLYLQASSYDQSGYLSKALTLAEKALADKKSLSAELCKLFCHLRSLIGYKLGHTLMSDFYWQSFLVERDADMFSSYLLTFNCRDVVPELVLEKSLGYGRLFQDVPLFQHYAHRPHQRLRIGYISPDFRFHVMYKFYQVLLGEHDLDKYEVYAYSLTDKPDKYTAICAQMVEHWQDLEGLNPQEAAQCIYDDEIDILFDLAGHTAGGSLPILARKPAPVQISGLGYMATTGLPAVDYFVTDALVDPLGQNDEFFTEKLLRLTSQFCYTPELANLPVSLGAPCLRRGWILFGVFNAYRKFTQEMLFLWKEILEKVPNSKLLLKCQVFFAPAMVEEAYYRFKKVGFDMERVIFEPASRKYMERYLDVDIALDTYPYPGGGTTCDALYMGVPVVSRFSSRHSTRFSYSLLANIGLGDLAAASRQEYVERAVALAREAELLDMLHKQLRKMMLTSPVMDREAYIRDLENHYQDIWQAWNKGD